MRWFLVALWLFNSSVVQAGLLNKLKSLGQTLQQQQASPRSQNIDDATFPLSDEPVTGPGGIVARCSDFIKVKNDKEAFNVHRQDWTPEILDFLKNTVDGCAQQKINLQTPNNYDIKVLQIEGESKQMKIYLDGAYSDGIYQKKQQEECLFPLSL